MNPRLIWDEAKRQSNLQKHGLDFSDAVEVLGSRFRLDISQQAENELRLLSISYALGVLVVLSGVHTERDGYARVISFRRASRLEREAYDARLENECDES